MLRSAIHVPNEIESNTTHLTAMLEVMSAWRSSKEINSKLHEWLHFIVK